MSTVIAWMVGEGEKGEANNPGRWGVGDDPSHVSQKRRDPATGSGQAVGHPSEVEGSAEGLPVHHFPAYPQEEAQAATVEEELEVEQERRIYRGRTVTMLRRYMRYALETGRLPSLLGREFFRAKVTRYTVVTFEDRVIFVHDMEICLERLDEFSRDVLGRVVLQEYDHEQAARLLHCTRMTVHRRLLQALDQLSDILLEVGLLEAVPAHVGKSCQEGEEGEFFVSDCDQGK